MAKANILLVEDDTNLGFVVKDNLQMNGYSVTLSANGSEGLKEFKQSNFDLCLLDVMLPQKDGFTLADDIKNINPNAAIIFLTAKAMDEDKIKGLKLGADDYITKPFNFDELLLRIEAVMRRTSSSSDSAETKEGIFNLGSVIFDSNNYRIDKSGKELKRLTKKESEILKMLCKSEGKIIERGIILKLIWGDDSYFNGRSLDVFITKLRKYLQDETVEIQNIHGVGFKLEVKK
jgi:two-component system, OmpR family, response regulator